MLMYRTPGVYFEWLDTRLSGIEPVRTDIAGIVGIAARGPLHQPMKVESWSQFTSTFGGHVPQGYLAYAVEGFFVNGGQTCWVVRCADPAQARPAQLTLLDDTAQPTLCLTASSRGTWGHEVTVSVVRLGAERFSLMLSLGDDGQELWRNLSMNPGDAAYVETVLNAERTGSRLVKVEDLYSPAGFPRNTPDPQALTGQGTIGRLSGGKDGLATLGVQHLSGDGAPPDKRWGLATLEDIDEVSILAMPDIMPKISVPGRHKERQPRCDVLEAESFSPSTPERLPELPPPFDDEQIRTLQSALIIQCEKLKDRIAILDSQPSDISPAQVLSRRAQFSTSYAALYYPWLGVLDPQRLEGILRAVPPSGHVAGVYARTDRRLGVHKPPANEVVEGARDVVVATDDIAHGDLNANEVNVIRSYAGRGIRVVGARTLSDDSTRRYINVRRLLIMIEEAIDEGTQWAVFEPNNPALWSSIDRVARSFLDDLWRRGMLDGASAEEAYSVRCDETTNPPEVTDAGRMICLIGVQPPWPAEFVIVRVGKTAGSATILETQGTSNA